MRQIQLLDAAGTCELTGALCIIQKGKRTFPSLSKWTILFFLSVLDAFQICLLKGLSFLNWSCMLAHGMLSRFRKCTPPANARDLLSTCGEETKMSSGKLKSVMLQVFSSHACRGDKRCLLLK